MTQPAEGRAAGWIVDHVFVFVAPKAPEAATLRNHGLVESFRRSHPGQGTANVCFCFDNAYLELLWVVDAAEATSCALSRSGLIDRAVWRRTGASPFGIALRHDDPRTPLPFPSWNYPAPFLPDGITIPVALASDDPRQPFLFRSPGGLRPDEWSDGRAGDRQQASGLTEIAGIGLAFPEAVAPHPDIEALAAAGLFAVDRRGAAPAMEFSLRGRDGAIASSLRLPEMRLGGYG